ncbi:unnamed protein product [Closterium sp. Yama58-4]|nr:unnamed protein product [Closterium sp. Yama58-4]
MMCLIMSKTKESAARNIFDLIERIFRIVPHPGDECDGCDACDGSMASEEGHTVYLGGLPFDSDEGAIKKVFEEFGEVLSAKVIYDRETGKARGFGFVTFASPKAAQDAIKAMDGEIVDGRPIKVSEGGAGGESLEALREAVERARREKQSVAAQMQQLEQALQRATATEVSLKERIKVLEAAKKQVAAGYEEKLALHSKALAAVARVQEAQETLAARQRELQLLLQPALITALNDKEGTVAAAAAGMGAAVTPSPGVAVGSGMSSLSQQPLSSPLPAMLLPSQLHALQQQHQGQQAGGQQQGQGQQPGQQGMYTASPAASQQQGLAQGVVLPERTPKLPILLPLQAQQQGQQV